MKKLLLTIACVLAVAVATAQSMETKTFLYFKKRDTNRELVSEHYTYATLEYNAQKQFVFTEGKSVLTFNILESDTLTTEDKQTTKFYKVQTVENNVVMWLQIFDDEQYGVRFIIAGQGTYSYLPY